VRKINVGDEIFVYCDDYGTPGFAIVTKKCQEGFEGVRLTFLLPTKQFSGRKYERYIDQVLTIEEYGMVANRLPIGRLPDIADITKILKNIYGNQERPRF